MVHTTRRLIGKAHAKAFAKYVADLKQTHNIQEISPIDLKQQLDGGQDMMLIDVREDHERQQFYVDASIHISKGVLERDIESVISLDNQDKKIVTICSGGYRSLIAAASLIAMGYQNVYSLAGGLKGYLEMDFDNIIENDASLIKK